MERVQYQLERSLPELQQLDQEGVFTKEELRSLTAQRAAFEARLVRRIADRQDFLRYVQFENDSERLRRIRVQRLDLPPSASSRSRASHSARVISIFERAVRKFRYDLAVWHAYISWAKSRGMRVVVGRVYARALQLHPGSTQLWIDAAAHELGANSSPTAARALLQRGIRINKLPFAAPAQAPLSADGKAGQKRKAAPRRRKRGDKRAKLEGEGSASDEQNSSDDEHPAQEPTPSSTPSPSPSASSSRATIKLADKECDLLRLWVEYVRMELVFVERIRRRWAVLGIDPTAASQSGKNALEPQKDDASEEGRDQEESREENAVLEAVPVERADADADADADAESSGVQKAEVSAANEGQRAVLQGAIIRAVCEAALKELAPHTHFILLLSLTSLLSTFPLVDTHQQPASGSALRASLLDPLYKALSSQFGTSPSAQVRCALRPLLDPPSHAHPADIEGADEELAEASKLQPHHSAPLDDLVEQAQDAPSPLALILSMLSSALPTQVAALGPALVPAIRGTSEALRASCVARPSAQMHEAATRTLSLLRASPALDESNLRAYLGAVLRRILRGAQKGSNSASLEIVKAEVKFAELEETSISNDAETRKESWQKLAQSLEDATRRYSTAARLWTLRTRVYAQVLADEDADTARTKIGALWLKALKACQTNRGLWEGYLDWVELQDAEPPAGAQNGKSSKQAIRRARGAYEDAIRRTASLLSAPTSLGTSDISESDENVNAEAEVPISPQDLHDYVLQRFIRFVISAEAKQVDVNKAAEKAFAHVVTRAFASRALWIWAVGFERKRLGLGPVPASLGGAASFAEEEEEEDQEDGRETYTTFVSLPADAQTHLRRLYERALPSTSTSDPNAVRAFLMHLHFLLHDQSDPRGALVTLEKAKKVLSSAEERERLEMGWMGICGEGPQREGRESEERESKDEEEEEEEEEEDNGEEEE